MYDSQRGFISVKVALLEKCLIVIVSVCSKEKSQSS